MNNTSVVDLSFILKYLLKDEQNDQVDLTIRDFREQKIELIAPELLGVEVANALRSAVMRGRITKEEALLSMGVFIELKIKLLTVDLQRILEVAFEQKISCYDASYVALARAKGANLLTYDERLKGL